MVIKSVHIKECWPYEYVPPIRRMHSEDAKKRQNELKRARYARAGSVAERKAKAMKTTKGQGSKKLLGLKVFELDIDFCKELNNGTSRS